MSRNPVTVAQLLARQEELEDALRPFAQLIAAFGHCRDEQRIISTANRNILAADIKQAAAALGLTKPARTVN